MRLAGKKAIVIGAGQTPGETIGNGRAAAVLFAREGAEVMCVDKRLSSAQDTVDMITGEGGAAFAHECDITSETANAEMVKAALARMGRIDILHNNVGIGFGDAPPHQLTEEVYDQIMLVNLKAMWLTCKQVIPVMREQKSGAIINISSAAAVSSGGITAYEISKAGVNKLTQSIAMNNAKHGVRCNVIMPGLMDTPMAIEGNVKARGLSREEVRAMRDRLVPLRGKMGSGWDVAYGALYLASDEANFVTGAVLPIDGGHSAKVG
ncbi:MAG: SDR family NAD(P)-dependent oxidoreductase [Pseudomonadota bacterium]|jgi:NAD(P)-dependent dehydrogenase (short-subunit alcohol dehydrogenase family)